MSTLQPAPGFTAPATSSSPGYWLVKRKDGAVGVVHGSINANTYPVQLFLGTTLTDASLVASKVIGSIGATAAQQASIAQTFDVGTIEQGGKFVWIPKDQQPGQTSTDPKLGQSPSGNSADPTNILPSPISPNAGNESLSQQLGSIFGGLDGIAVRVLEAVGGVLLLVLGLRALLGGDSPTVAIARTAAKVAK